MFCSKCGLQNADETKFCRGCGADLANVLAIVDHKAPETRAVAEKHIELFSAGVRGLTIGAGFFIVSALAFILSTNGGLAFSLFTLMFAFFFAGTGFSRLIHARGLKAIGPRNEPAKLSTGQTEFIKPSRSIYETDDLAARQLSVTENTTRHLDPDTDALAIPQK